MTEPRGTRVWLEQNYSAASASANVGRVFPGMAMPFEDRTDLPALTLRNHVKSIIIERGVPVPSPPMQAEKPPYRVPTMAEIAALEPNGFCAVSTFSGCGGSSLGYRMAGFRMLWASEFVEAARETYRANAAPYTILDGRDIREVTGADILAATGKARGEIDLFDGSPPCASFSTAGKREKGWGKVKEYSDTEQRSDDLFFEFARLIGDVQPRTFVAENVSGLVKGTAKGYFKLILARLRSEGYRVSARVLDASWLGVPQARQRLIFVGVREDLGMDPVHPRPMAYQYTVRDALPWITSQGDNGGFGTAEVRSADRPSPTIGASPQSGNGRAPASLVEAQVRDARVIHDTSGNVPPVDVTDRPCRSVTTGANSVNSYHYQVHEHRPELVIRDVTNTGASRMEQRSIDQPLPTITAGGIGSASRDQACVAWPVHPPLVLRDQGSDPKSVSVDQPAPTLMARGIGGVHRDQAALTAPQGPAYNADGAALDPETGQKIGMEGLSTVVAWDRAQAAKGIEPPQIERRRFTLGELRAIGGFPPDFVLTGTYGQRWERIGRAVPPVMMQSIAAAVRDEILVPLRERGVI